MQALSIVKVIISNAHHHRVDMFFIARFTASLCEDQDLPKLTSFILSRLQMLSAEALWHLLLMTGQGPSKAHAAEHEA